MSDSWASGRFHDAEVIAVRLDRSGPALELRVMTPVGATGQQSLLLRFEGISEMELTGFNEQNALFDIGVEEVAGGGWQVRLSSSYGLAGSFQCTEVSDLPPIP
jgi:hypothetical protein